MLSLLRRTLNITKLSVAPPRAAPNRYGLAIVAIIKNEARYLAEWAQFHHLAGARHFYIYDNGSTDGSCAALRAAVPSDMLTIIPWQQKFHFGRFGAEIHNQVLAYAHAVMNFGAGYRWMTWIDIDEFLVPKQAGDLNTALHGLEGQRMISLPWHMFGRSGHKTPPDGGVVPNYLWRNPDPMHKSLCKFKVIADPCHVTAVKVHWMEVDNATISSNDRGMLAKLAARIDPGFYSADRLQLNHYYTRSDADIAEKLDRGPNVTTPAPDNLRRVMAKVALIEAAQVADTAARDWLARRKDQSP